MSKEFRLMEKDKVWLSNAGYPDEEFAQIEEFANEGSYATENGKYVSWLTAKRMLGWEEFLSGISRAAFHWTAMRKNPKTGYEIFIDFGNCIRRVLG